LVKSHCGIYDLDKGRLWAMKQSLQPSVQMAALSRFCGIEGLEILHGA
jgi:hypothetical protein